MAEKPHWAQGWADDLAERAEILREDALELSKRDDMGAFVTHDLRQAALRIETAADALRNLAAAQRGTP